MREFDVPQDVMDKKHSRPVSIPFPAITRNAARCRNCSAVVESTHVHDYVVCSCGSIAVDGGHEYLRRVGDLHDFEDLSEYAEE